jgi:hypothetical protein
MAQNGTRNNQNSISGLVITAALTGTGSAATLFTAGSTGVFIDIVSLVITSSTTTAQATLSDGTVSYVFNVANGSPVNITFPVPLKATSAATAWTLNAPNTMNAIAVGITATN